MGRSTTGIKLTSTVIASRAPKGSNKPGEGLEALLAQFLAKPEARPFVLGTGAPDKPVRARQVDGHSGKDWSMRRQLIAGMPGVRQEHLHRRPSPCPACQGGRHRTGNERSGRRREAISMR